MLPDQWVNEIDIAQRAADTLRLVGRRRGRRAARALAPELARHFSFVRFERQNGVIELGDILPVAV